MAELLVADSFRVRERGGASEVRGFAMHLDRFRAGVDEMIADASGEAWRERLESFMAAAPGEIARAGEGFPRLEARRGPGGAPSFGVRTRPLPTLTRTVALRTATRVELVSPRVKGPNIEMFAALGRELGAEPLLVDEEGRAVEGATVSLLWWEGGALCSIASPRRVDSVTERLVLGIARRLGLSTEQRDPDPGHLAAHEVWSVNALHGIRPVASIDGAETRPVDGERLETFRDALDDTWQSVHEPAPGDA